MLFRSGINQTHRLLWNSAKQELSQDPILGNVIQKSGHFTLLTPTGTTEIALQYEAQSQTLFSLPENSWRFSGKHLDYTLLRKPHAWLAVDFKNNTIESKIIEGDNPIWSEKDATRAVVLDNNQVSIWDLKHGANVVWRRSDRVIATAWHRSGKLIFLATEHDVLALDLDSRNGNIVYQLSSFDRVYDIAVLNQALYIAAEQNGRHGVFVQRIE